jgi:hypothetical protein
VLDPLQIEHILDVETSGVGKRSPSISLGIPDFLAASQGDFASSLFAKQHENTQLLQVYATNIPFYERKFKGFAATEYAQTYVKPGSGYYTSKGFVGYNFSRFSNESGIVKRAYQFGSLSEEQAAHAFYKNLSFQVGSRQSTVLSGWNVGYDLSMMETLTHRYESLSKYRGFFASNAGSGRLQIKSLEDPFLQLAFEYGKANPEFAKKYFRSIPAGKVAANWQELRGVPGWSVGNIIEAARAGGFMRPTDSALHESVIDVNSESLLSSGFSEALQRVRGGEDFDSALKRGAGFIESKDARSFFESVYKSGWNARLAREEAAGATLLKDLGGIVTPTSWRKAAIGAGVLGAAAVAYGLAFGTRNDRQTQITGLHHGGLAELGRHKRTDFGSGYLGSKEEHPTLHLSAILAGAAGSIAFRRYLKKGGAQKVFTLAKKLEDFSPGGILKTLSLSERASSYTASEIIYKAEDLFRGGRATQAGEHLERVTGLKFNERTTDLRFIRTKTGSHFLNLEGTNINVRFAHKGRLSGASYRLGKPLSPAPSEFAKDTGSTLGNILEWFKTRAVEQRPLGYGAPESWQPLYSSKFGASTHFEAFQMGERTNRLLAGFGVGLRRGTYNDLIHFPFAGGGRAGVVNELLTRRVLPLAIGLTALSYLDYKLDHKPRDFVASIPLRANILRADITDAVPSLRSVTDFYKQNVPGPQYGPLALPFGGMAIDAFLGYARRVKSGEQVVHEGLPFIKRLIRGKGARLGLLAMLPFVPGMIGSRETSDELRDIYSGRTPVAVRSGRLWDVGSTPLEGGRIKYFRPHWYARMRSGAAKKALYGSEEEYWANNPLLHPVNYLKDPYALERKNYYSHPYPITSPAGSNIPLVGPIIAGTIGRLIKPPVRMHTDEWSDTSDYKLFGNRMEPKEGGLKNEEAVEEFGFKNIAKREYEQFLELSGLPGWLMKVSSKMVKEDADKEEVYLAGSRQMTSLSRRYYEMELGGLHGPGPEGLTTGYSEPLRRFIQREPNELQANEIPNEFANLNWLPGDDYFVNFKRGDAFSKIQEGYMRLPGPGYAALNPDVEGLSPEEYPDWHRFKILSDVAPYSTEWFKASSRVGREVSNDTARLIEYQKIMDQVKELKASSVDVRRRRFSAPVDEVEGTVSEASPAGVSLEEYPGRLFKFSSVGMRAADLSAVVMGETNNLTRSQVAQTVEERSARLGSFLSETFRPGTKVTATVGRGAADNSQFPHAVFRVDGKNINQELIDMGLASNRIEDAGPEARAMSKLGSLFGGLAENLSFTGDSGPFNPLNYIPTPYHTKLWQQRTARAQYETQEVYGTKARRGDKPFDFLSSYFGGLAARLTGQVVPRQQVRENRELNTLTDQLNYLSAISEAAADPSQRSRGRMRASRTNIGADLTGSADWVSKTLSRKDRQYYPYLAEETDPEERAKILKAASPELARTLSTQWVKQGVQIAKEAGQNPGEVISGGRLVTPEKAKEYEEAKTALGFADYLRSREIANLFHRRGLHLPSPGDEILDPNIDYEDVKMKILQEEGYDYHDFGIFRDRATTLWRKPYLDGAVRELTSGDTRTVEQMRQAVEQVILASTNGQGNINLSSFPSRTDQSDITFNIQTNPEDAILTDVRRNRDKYGNP